MEGALHFCVDAERMVVEIRSFGRKSRPVAHLRLSIASFLQFARHGQRKELSVGFFTPFPAPLFPVRFLAQLQNT